MRTAIAGALLVGLSAGCGSSSGASKAAGGASSASVSASSSSASVGASSGGGSLGSSGSAASSSASSGSASSSGGAGACQFPHDYPNGNASLTYYTFAMGGSAAVNCSFAVLGTNPDIVESVPFGGGQYFGAMNTADYDAAAVCGACIEVDRADTGQKVDIMVVDQCPTASNPKCTAGHIDMSEAAFLQVGTAQEGYLGTGNGAAVGVISWHYVPCPETGGVSVVVKPGSNQYFTQFLVEDHATPIAKLSVNGQDATRESYNEWQAGSGNSGAGPFQLRMTDVNGEVIAATIPLDPGTVQKTTVQFPTCQ